MDLKKIRNMTLALLKKSDSYRLPVNVEKIAGYLDIKVINDSFEDDVSGLLVIKSGKAAIGINRRHGSKRKRFTIAHEIGHYKLHHNKNNDDEVFVDKKWAYFRSAKSSKGIDPKEIEANKFAAELLMPNILLKEYITKNDINLFDEFSIPELSNFLEVSEEALSIRLMQLGFISAY